VSEASFCSSVAAADEAVRRAPGRQAGIGLTFLKAAPGGLPVKRVKEGGAAAAEGSIRPGELVVSIDGAELAALDKQALARAMMGPEGSAAALMVAPAGGGAPRAVTLVRKAA
jgi:C-terminal processing protease CtpA/Prc